MSVKFKERSLSHLLFKHLINSDKIKRRLLLKKKFLDNATNISEIKYNFLTNENIDSTKSNRPDMALLKPVMSSWLLKFVLNPVLSCCSKPFSHIPHVSLRSSQWQIQQTLSSW